MKKTDFLQAKMTFLMRYPQLDDLTFYRKYTEQHPTAAIGWLHYGQALEQREDLAKAL